jgi:hypothetical protein
MEEGRPAQRLLGLDAGRRQHFRDVGDPPGVDRRHDRGDLAILGRPRPDGTVQAALAGDGASHALLQAVRSVLAGFELLDHPVGRLLLPVLQELRTKIGDIAEVRCSCSSARSPG